VGGCLWRWQAGSWSSWTTSLLLALTA